MKPVSTHSSCTVMLFLTFRFASLRQSCDILTAVLQQFRNHRATVNKPNTLVWVAAFCLDMLVVCLLYNPEQVVEVWHSVP